MSKILPGIFDRIVKWFKSAMREDESKCRNCGVCHHVCDLLGRKNRTFAKPREE